MVKVYWCKVFKTKYELVVAICDEELVEKEIKLGKSKIKISKDFYGGKLIDERVAIKLMEKATIGNLIGNDIVELAEGKEFITRENVIFINGIPHAQFVKI